jgi:hypothetical protein
MLVNIHKYPIHGTFGYPPAIPRNLYHIPYKYLYESSVSCGSMIPSQGPTTIIFSPQAQPPARCSWRAFWAASSVSTIRRPWAVPWPSDHMKQVGLRTVRSLWWMGPLGSKKRLWDSSFSREDIAKNRHRRVIIGVSRAQHAIGEIWWEDLMFPFDPANGGERQPPHWVNYPW